MTDASPALERLYHWESTAPDRVCLTQPMGGGETRDFTWGEVGEQVRRMAAHLEAQGWEPGSRIAILSKNCAWWLFSDLAIWMAGHVSVPLYPTLAADTVRQILIHSEAKTCFVGKLDGWEAMAPGVPDTIPCITFPLSPAAARSSHPDWDELCAAVEPLQGRPTRAAGELATIIYTSGTTGVPKGVMHSFGNFSWALDAGIERIPMTADDRMLSYLPLAHVVERVLIEHGWLRTGMHVFFADSLDSFALDMQRARPTIFFSVPRLWVKFQQGVHHKLPEAKLRRLLRLPVVGGLVRAKVRKGLGLDQCRIAAGGAAPMPGALLEWFADLGVAINEGYGMTENLAVSHITIPGKNQRGTVGPAYRGVEHRVDPSTGEVQMRSPALLLGYYKEEQLTRDTFTDDGWLKTGDKGTIDGQGLLRITGRVKDLFKTGKGKYVAPAPIEDKLMMHPAIEACIVTGANLGQPVGIVMLGADGAATPRDELERSLLDHLEAVNAGLDPHERLQCLALTTTPWTVENDLVTPTFKVKRDRIDQYYGGAYEQWEADGRRIVWIDGHEH